MFFINGDLCYPRQDLETDQVLYSYFQHLKLHTVFRVMTCIRNVTLSSHLSEVKSFHELNMTILILDVQMSAIIDYGCYTP